MRKDVKIGLAIAGVLFAVLIVYVFTPKGETQNEEVAVNEGEQQPVDESGQTPPTSDVPSTETPSVPQEPVVAAPGDAFAPGESTVPAEPGSASADAGKPAGNTDWLKTFDTGVVALDTHPPLVAQSVTPTPGGTPVVPSVPGEAVTDVHHGPADAATPTVPAVGEATGAMADAGTAASPATETSVVPSPTAPAPLTIVSSGGARTHVVQRGETFSTIAKAVYGNSKYYLQIVKANPQLDPSRLKVGTEIKLPDISAAVASEASAKTASATIPGNRPAPAVNSATEYRIQPGDSLYKISVKLYGNGAHVDELYETNAAAIGDDPARLKVGMVIKLHDAPRVSQPR